MLSLIINILNQKWSFVIAFVPGANLLYLVFRFFIKTKNCQLSFLHIGLIGTLLSLLYLVLPNSLNWLITHLIISGIAAYVMYISRETYLHQVRVSKDAFFFFSVWGVIILAVACFSPQLIMASRISQKTEIALHAIVENDETTWSSLIHPNCEKDIEDLQKYKSELYANGIILNEDFRYGTGRSSAAAVEKVEEGKAVGQDVLIESGGITYIVCSIWQENEHGVGFVNFEIQNP